MDAKTVVFFCNWSSYPGLQMSKLPDNPVENNKLLVSMCSGRISPELIWEAFKKGAWGVMVSACPKDKCEHDGNYQTVGRVSLMKEMLSQMGYESDRLHLEWIDKGESAKLKTAIDEFAKRMDALGPLVLPMEAA